MLSKRQTSNVSAAQATAHDTENPRVRVPNGSARRILQSAGIKRFASYTDLARTQKPSFQPHVFILNLHYRYFDTIV